MEEYFLRNLKGIIFLTSCFDNIIEYRDTVYRACGIRLEIRTKEEGSDKIPHCHAYHQGQFISINLLDFSILETNLRFEKTKLAIKFVKDNIDILLDTWKNYHRYYQIDI